MNRTSPALSEATTLPVPESEFRDDRHARIARRAFEIYEARGGEHGQDLDDWLQAERQIDDEFGEINRPD